jgi:hypothetical protein
MTQIWYFQLEGLLHLPFMLRASTERRYEYSKFTCLKASREVIYRYNLLRGAKHNLFCCNVVDFGMCNILFFLSELSKPKFSRHVLKATDEGQIFIEILC